MLTAIAIALLTTQAQAQTSAHDLRYNEVYRVATHNSYWVSRDDVVDPFASGTQERLLDQLLFERARGLEIDVHKDDTRPGNWNVYHTDRPGNAICNPFAECLKQLAQFQYALPRHEVLTVVIELKEILDYNFDAAHRPADFDALLERQLGPVLYRPRDFLARCAPGSTLAACAREKGWPTIEELRGKIIFAVLGNWRWCTIGHGPTGWATYATADGGAKLRSAFPMSSDYSNLTKEGCGSEYFPPEPLKAAYDASIFEQVENVTDAANMSKAAAFVAAGGVVRGHDAWTLADQQARIAAGFHMLQTDYPWVQLGDPGFKGAFRPLDPAAGPILEPGQRIALTRVGRGTGFAFASMPAAAAHSEWETLPSTTRPSANSALPNAHWTRGKGCLRAASRDDSFSVCRQTIGGHWNVDKPLGEDIAVTVEVIRAGQRQPVLTFYSADSTSAGAGDQLRLTIDRDSKGRSCATAWTAAEVAWAGGRSKGHPLWKQLSTECFKERLAREGLAARWGDVLFVHTLHDGRPVSTAALAVPTPITGYQYQDDNVEEER